MQTISIAEAAENFVGLVARLNGESVLVLDGDEIVATITPARNREQQRAERWKGFLAASEQASAELKRNLDKEGISVEEFLEDVLRDEP